MTRQKIESRLVQLGNRSDERTGAVSTPIYLSTAYEHQGLGESTGYDYSRTKNPTRQILEDGIADLENGHAGFACSSGMAAIQLVLSLFNSGDSLLFSADVYGGTYRLLKQYEEKYNIRASYSDFTSVAAVEALITKETKAIFIETPTNPLMQTIDISVYAELAKKYGLLFIVDNTFLTPYLQQPLELGADIVIHSATKYIGGHNDVLAGLVVAKDEDISELLATNHNSSGAVLSPADSFLVVRGMKTLGLRMTRHEENAKKMVEYLNEQDAIENVLYPGVGGMLSFRLHDKALINLFLQNLQLITFAESLGGVESFITYPTTQTHADIPLDERKRRGVDDRLLRFSVGIEHIDDLIADLEQVFNKIQKAPVLD